MAQIEMMKGQPPLEVPDPLFQQIAALLPGPEWAAAVFKAVADPGYRTQLMQAAQGGGAPPETLQVLSLFDRAPASQQAQRGAVPQQPAAAQVRLQDLGLPQRVRFPEVPQLPGPRTFPMGQTVRPPGGVKPSPFLQ